MCSSLILVLFVVSSSAVVPDSGALASLSLSGHVRDERDRPIRKATVHLYPIENEYKRAHGWLSGREKEPVAQTWTGHDGGFVLAVPGEGFWEIAVSSPGRLSMRLPLTPLLESTELPALTLPEARQQSLTVRSFAGEPLTSARVGIELQPARHGRDRTPDWRPTRQWVRTDQGGLARLETAAGFVGRMSVVAPGHSPRIAWFRGGSVPLENRLDHGKPVRLEVTTVDGSNAARVLVWLGSTLVAKTDDFGRARLHLPTTGTSTILIMAEAGEFGIATLDGEATEATEPEVVGITLRAPPAVAGLVLDGSTKMPVESAYVWDAADPATFVRTGKDGRFRSPYHERDVHASSLMVAAKGYASATVRAFESTRANVYLAPIVEVFGLVQDRGGTPLAGVRVSAEPSETKAESGSDGRFVLPLVAGGRYTLHAFETGLLPSELDYLVGGSNNGFNSPVVLTLGRGSVVAGRIVDGHGRGLAGAQVRVQSLSSVLADTATSVWPRDQMTLGTVTDPEGHFELGLLPFGRLRMVASAPGFISYDSGAFSIDESYRTLDLGPIELQPGLALEGWVEDQRGDPIEGVRIKATNASSASAGDDGEVGRLVTYTNKEGRFALRELGAFDVVDLLFEGDGFSRLLKRGIRLPRREPLEVTIEEMAEIRGLVVGPDGKGVPGAIVMPHRSETLAGSSAKGLSTDQDGRFELASPPGRVLLTVAAAEFSSAQKWIELSPGASVDGLVVALDEGTTLAGIVKTAEGDPVVGARVELLPGSLGNQRPRKATTDEEGFYRLVGLSPGHYPVLIRANGYPSLMVEELWVGPHGAQHDFTLVSGHRVAGHVVDAEGLPVADARVYARDETQRSAGYAATDPHGAFELRGVPDGRYKLQVTAKGLATSWSDDIVVAGGQRQEIRVQMDAGFSVHGTVRGLSPDDLGAVEISLPALSNDISRTDGKGQFLLAGVPSGRWYLMARETRSGRSVGRWFEADAGEGEVFVEISFDEGLSVRGRLLVDGHPQAGAFVTAEFAGLPQGVNAWTDETGAFSFQGLEQGGILLRLSSPLQALAHRSALNLEHDEEIVFEFVTHGLAGKLHEATTGNAIPGVLVTVEPHVDSWSQLETSGWIVTDTLGRFDTGLIAPGRYTVTADAPGFELRSVPYEVGLSGHSEALLIGLEPAGEVSD